MPTAKKSITSAWTLVSAAASGFMENQGPQGIKFRTASASPAATDDMGHQLKLDEFRGWSRQTAENIYARTISGTATLIVTEG
ncbi:hypothetical protein [Aeromonas sp. JL9]|uniref:hypothetical protein n=1 Tax=Aeromonas sp. JL9 TaxID=2950549 RepID=UPI00210F041D|nr:hypothetical protein [Aeromonas sp. JL9]MCQ4108082.1 hypothetical protein [Aeromonas sp. JL9]